MRFIAKRGGPAAMLVTLVALAGCNAPKPAADCGSLAATDAWVTPAHAGSREMFGYLKLHNEGSRDVVIKGVSSTQFDRAILQTRTSAGDNVGNTATAARPLAPFTVAAGSEYDLAPNEHEIALYSPTQTYGTGDQVELKLVCGRDQATLAVPAVVRRGEDADIGLSGADDDTRRTEKALRGNKATSDDVSASDDSRTAH